MSEEDISLFELVNLSIGTPEVGAVNFNALHMLLHAILRQLDIREVKTKWKEVTFVPTHPESQESGELTTPSTTEDKEPPNGRTESSSSPPPSSITVGEMKDLESQIQTNKDDVSKALELTQGLLEEMQSLKESMKELHLNMGKMNVDALAETLAAIEECCHRVADLETTTRSLRDMVQHQPDREELSQFVTWEDMQSALLGDRGSFEEPVGSIAALSRDNKSESTPIIFASSNSEERRDFCSRPEPAKTSTIYRTNVSDRQVPLSLDLPLSSLLDETPIKASDHPQSYTPPQMETKTISATASSAEHYPETVEALRSLSKLKEQHSRLEARVTELEMHKADQAQMEELKQLINEEGTKDVDKNLQDELNHQRALIKTLMGNGEKNKGLIMDMQNVQMVVKQVQAECEKIHQSSRQLQDDSSQTQRHIEQLYKRMEHLEGKKADKELIKTEIEIKADKCALDDMVSQMQFDSVTEQLKSAVHQLLSKVSDQDHDWQKVIDKVYTEMECKSNRIELDSVKKQLEDRWKNTYKRLQSQTAPEQDDAAVVRKQLVDRFNCLSCDRPISIHTPGPQCVALPCAPGLPVHKSNRPYTVYGRHHYSSERFPAKSRSLRVSPTRRHQGHNMQDILSEIDGMVQEFDIDAFGQDMPIYRQRLNSPALKNIADKLPMVSHKDGRSRDKAKRFTSHKRRESPEPRCNPAPLYIAKGHHSRPASADPCLEEGPSTNL